MLASGINPEASRIRRQLLPANTTDKPTDSGHEKARRIHAIKAGKQLHRWIDEGGALLPDDANSDSDSVTESDPEAAAATV